MREDSTRCNFLSTEKTSISVTWEKNDSKLAYLVDNFFAVNEIISVYLEVFVSFHEHKMPENLVSL